MGMRSIYLRPDDPCPREGCPLKEGPECEELQVLREMLESHDFVQCLIPGCMRVVRLSKKSKPKEDDS